MTKKISLWMQSILLAGATAALSVTTIETADAQQRSICGKRAMIMERLEAQYSEQPVAIGLDSKGGVMEMLAGPSGSWTIIRTNAKGLTCFMATGVAFEKMEPLDIEPSA
ncbi:MAG: hypothetical protein AAGF58_04000 [Pseudomonadota bacterium]